VTKRERGAAPPTSWERPDGGKEPVREPTRKELFDMLGRLGHLPKLSKGRCLDDALHWQLTKLLAWLLYGERILTPRGLKTQAGIDLIRATLFAQGIEAVGWSGAGDWAAEQSRAWGDVIEGESATMAAAYKKNKHHFGRPLTYRPHPSRIASSGH